MQYIKIILLMIILWYDFRDYIIQRYKEWIMQRHYIRIINKNYLIKIWKFIYNKKIYIKYTCYTSIFYKFITEFTPENFLKLCDGGWKWAAASVCGVTYFWLIVIHFIRTGGHTGPHSRTFAYQGFIDNKRDFQKGL